MPLRRAEMVRAATKLHQAVAAIAPIHGVAVGDWDDRTTWYAHYDGEPTEQQAAAVATLIASFDLEAARAP